MFFSDPGGRGYYETRGEVVGEDPIHKHYYVKYPPRDIIFY
jgi:hypothetical protein